MKKSNSILVFILAVFMVFTLAACSGGNDNNDTPSNTPNTVITQTPEPTQEPTPEPLPSYTFEEIVIKEPTRFSERGDKISVDVSGVKNYYGEISVGNRSYLSDFNSSLDGTYALFVVDEGTVPLRITIGDDGYASWFDLTGVVKGNDVEYNGSLYTHNSNPITQVKRNYEAEKQIKDLSILRVDWGRNKGSSEWNFVMLSVVITESEAVRYVQEGTLPKCLQGLTVKGLDEIFGKPGYEPGDIDAREALENQEAPATDFEYDIADGEVTINLYIGDRNKVVIPAYIDDMPVTVIGDRAFSKCVSLTDITIPQSVTVIDYGAFSECSSLVSLTMPEGVTAIGEHAFSACTSLSNITIPGGVTIIGRQAFAGCTSLETVILEYGVTEIGRYAFSGCTALANVTLPNSLTAIADEAFSDCTSLVSVTVPESVTNLGWYVFKGCKSLDDTTKDKIISINPYGIE